VDAPRSTDPLTTTIIGIDCATQANKTGLCRAVPDGERWRILNAEQGAREPSVSERVRSWIDAAPGPCLLALDAPLGWPAALGPALERHVAGRPLAPEPDDLFRRLTDRRVKDQVRKQPLDVGADRIARTARAALELLAELGSVPLAWSPRKAKHGVHAIEVYPAGTLKSHGQRPDGYKKGDAAVSRRRSIVDWLAEDLEPGSARAALEEGDDLLDAALCVRAGIDFLDNLAPGPSRGERERALREGWIWVRSP